MPEENSAIAIIPSECFRWRARVQFIESFRTRAAALNFAFQHGYNLIVERNEGRSSLFDVLQDSDGACISGLDLELLKTEEVLVEPPSTSWTTLMLWTIWDLTRRFAALVAKLYAREIVPFSQRDTPLLSMYLRQIISLLRGADAVARLYLGEEIMPRWRHAASRMWWSDSALAFRRTWHRHSHGSAWDLVKRFAAIGSHCFREIVSRFRYAVSGYRVVDIEAAFRRASSISLAIGCNHAVRFAAVASTCLREIIHISRRTVTVAGTYLREIDAILRCAAARCWSDSTGDVPRQSWAVAAPRQSNPSQLH